MATSFRLSIVLLVLLLSVAISSPLKAVIYGTFDVYDYYEQSSFASVADRTFVLVHPDDLNCDQESCSFNVESLSEYYNVAPDDPMAKFGDQPTLGYCSGFLAGSSTAATDTADLVVTAGFCLPDDISDALLVLGWHVDSPEDDGWGSIPLNRVYQAVEEIINIEGNEGHYAVVRLDRPVPLTPLVLADSTFDLQPNDSVTCVGHSVGMPVKIHTNGWIRENRSDSMFIDAYLDVYAGIAGSPVIRSATQEVIGILVIGEPDWVTCEPYYCSNVISDYGYFSESMTRIDPVLPFLVGIEPGPTVDELLSDLVQKVTALNLQQGISNSLDAKLHNIIDALGDVNLNNDESAVRRLEAFINEVAAQAGNKIPIAAAEELTSSAREIIDLILAG